MKKTTKVLLVSPYSAKRVGGIGTWSKIILDYSKGCASCDVLFLNTAQGLPKRWALNHRLAHMIIGFFDSLLIFFRMFGRMLFSRPDVVHYTSSASSALYKDLIAIWIVKKLFRKRFVIHWHFGRIPSIVVDKGTEYGLLVRACRKADVSIVIDANSHKVLQREKIGSVYIPNPIPLVLQHEAEKVTGQELYGNRNPGEVLYVGHVRRGKGVYELVEACMECEKVKRLTLVGPFIEENVEAELRSIARRRDGGRWLQLVGEKKRDEVWDYYKRCSLFCLPSYREGFPYAVLEAMAFACPIVATKVGAIPEMLSGGCGELIEVCQTELLREAIGKVLDNPVAAAGMGKKANVKVLENYTVEKIFGRYCDVWR